MARHEAKKDAGESGLADQIRQAASESGLSVYALAKAADVDQSTLNKFLAGDRPNLRLDVVERLFKVLGITLTRRKSPRT